MAIHIVVIGGGFGGISLVTKLGGINKFRITLIDKNNYNFFPPLLYQVATGFLDPSNISYPFRKLFRNMPNAQLRMATLQKVIPEEKKIILDNGELTYDILVFACGVEINYFGMENVRRNALPMKTLIDAIYMRNLLLQRLEQATIITDKIERKKYSNIVIAGGGPTGVEISGMFAEMSKYIIRKDYPELTNPSSTANIYLVGGGGDAILNTMSKASQEETYKALTEMGVTVILNDHVKDFTDDAVILSKGDPIYTKTLIWAAGVTAPIFEGIPKESYGYGKRMIVDEYNQIINIPDIYAIGDVCWQINDTNYQKGYPQVAQVAIQQGKNLAKNLAAQTKNKPRHAFSYSDKGSMAIIGRNKAVVDIPKLKVHLKGFFAWLVWLFIHLVSLINYRNRITTLANWIVSYFSRDQSLRMIIKAEKTDKAE